MDEDILATVNANLEQLGTRGECGKGDSSTDFEKSDSEGYHRCIHAVLLGGAS